LTAGLAAISYAGKIVGITGADQDRFTGFSVQVFGGLSSRHGEYSVLLDGVEASRKFNAVMHTEVAGVPRQSLAYFSTVVVCFVMPTDLLSKGISLIDQCILRLVS
jgi:hypothetical protein